MKQLLHSFLLLILAALSVAAQPLFAQEGEPLAQVKVPCAMHGMAVGVDSAQPDAPCLNMEKCRGGCLCTGCGHCAHAVMPSAPGQHKLYSVSVLLQPLVVQYISLNSPPESPPPRSHSSC